MAVWLLSECTARRIDAVVVSTFRDPEAQAYLYNHQLSKWPPGWSFHEHRAAFDIMILRHGRPIGTTEAADVELWNQVGKLAVDLVGLEWAGAWDEQHREFPHFQHTWGRTIKDMQNGETLPETISGPRSFTGRGMSRWWRMKLSLAHWMMRRGESLYYSMTRPAR